MSVLFGSPTKPTKINHVQINQSVLGYPLPVVMGKAKVQQSLLWVDGMTSKSVKPGGGGKGLGGGKGSSLLYSADVIAALCNGPVSGVGDVWSGQSWLSNSNTSEIYTVAGGSPSYTPANASSGVFVDNGVSISIPYSNTQTDLGSGGAVTLAGSDNVSLKRLAFGSTLLTGDYSISTGNVYHFSPADVGKTVQISYSFALNTIKQQENDLIPSSKNVAVGGTFQFHEDDGVTYFTGPNNGVALTKVSGTPTVTGTYSVSGSGPATYHFAAGDIGHEVQITYKIQNNSIVPSGAPGRLAFSLFEGTQGQAAWSLLTSSYPQAALGYTGIAYVAYDPMTLGYAADIQQNVFEVFTADAFGGGIVDCNPVQCIMQVLTNPVWGLGAGAVPFPASAIDNGGSGSWGGPAGTPGARSVASTAWSWFASNNFFISPVIDHQDSAASVISKWLEAGQCAAFMSEGLLKLVPYGDTSTAGNGCTWVAPSAFAAALDDTCFVTKDGQDPVKISSSPWQDAYNMVQVQWGNRANQYSPEITPESDQAAINRYGSRIEDPQNWDFIRTLAAATFAASMRVKRNVYTRNTYEFSLPFSYSYLENMDVVNITTSSQWAKGLNNANLGITNLPVRITKVVDNPDGRLDITAEDYPFGVHQPTIYNKGIGAGQTQQNLFADPGDSEVVLFEAPSRLTGFQGNQIWIGATGVGKDWGSCNVLVSEDGVTYKQVGSITQGARLGALASTFATGSDPDTTHSMVVDLVPNCGALEAGTNADADAGNTICFVDGEILSYSVCTVTGQEQYTMSSYIRRGQMGSAISAHAAGGLFLRLDESIFKFTYDPTWAGKTIHLKFQSVNSFGNSPQDPSTLTAVSFTIPGLNPGTIDASSGLIVSPSQFNVGAGNIGWAQAATSTDGPVNYASGYGGLSGGAAPAGVNPTYFYARWTGYLVPSVSGRHTLGLNVDDTANLFIGGNPITLSLNTTGGAANNSLAYKYSATMDLTAGVYYPVVIEWEQAVGPYACQFIWTPPGGSIALVPGANLTTALGSITSNLSANWWNGTPGLWYPTGSASVDSTNPLLPTFSPPANVGTGYPVVNGVQAVTAQETVGASGNSVNTPGWFTYEGYVTGGQLIDLMVFAGAGIGSGHAGYFFRLDGRSGQVIGQILSVSNNTTSSWANIGTSYLAANAANLTGWYQVECYYGNGYLAIWVNGAKVCDALDNTYALPATAQTFYGYGNPGAPNPKIAPGAALQAGSTSLNQQGSIVPNQPLPTPGYTTSTTSIAFSWSSQSMALSDGSTVTIPSGTKTYSSLSAGTTYFFYPYIRCSDFTIQFANGSPPPTVISAAFALAANSDGCFGMNPIQASTTTSGGGSGGGDLHCPESAEIVDVLGRGLIPALQVQAGDAIKGHSFHDNADVYRKVVSVSSGPCGAWRIINGHKVSPCEPVWDGQAWTPAFKVTGAVFDGSAGIKVMLHVDSDDYEECNFYLVSGTPLLVHNQQPIS